jgi:hypothetical protein
MNVIFNAVYLDRNAFKVFYNAAQITMQFILPFSFDKRHPILGRKNNVIEQMRVGHISSFARFAGWMILEPDHRLCACGYRY